MKERCRAKNPSTCRKHGIGSALEAIDQALDAGRIRTSELFFVTVMKLSAEKYNPENRANGLVAEYEDGSKEIFYGEATDPRHASDWSFISTDTHKVLKGYQYSEDESDRDPATQGIHAIKTYQEEMSESLVGNYPVLAEGPDESAGEKKVKKITVL